MLLHTERSKDGSAGWTKLINLWKVGTNEKN